MKKKPHTGIPTMYKGIQFRSRLEARWACFMDLCGWRWKYEPLELNGWIPDFLISAYGIEKPSERDLFFSDMLPDPERDFILEVRPRGLQEGLADKIKRGQSGRDWINVVMVGDGPEDTGWWLDKIGDWYYSEDCRGSDVFISPMWVPTQKYIPEPVESKTDKGQITLIPHGAASRDLIYNREMNISYFETGIKSVPAELWLEAGNLTQWKGPKNHG